MTIQKKLLFILLFIGSYCWSQQQNVTFTVNPTSFQESEQITITVSNVNPGSWGVSDLYLWAWSFDMNDANSMDAPNNGSWESSNEAHKLSNNGNGTYSISFVPSTFYNRTNIGSIGFLIKAKDGTGDKKSQDQIVQIGTISSPTVIEAPLPNGMLDGLNPNPNDPTKVTLVLFAPLKQFVNIIGNFNNWQRDDLNYLLKKDSSKDRFWIELTGLSSQNNYTYQYLVDGQIRIADPYSTTILDENNDVGIDNITYPNLPNYPTGQTTHAVSLFRTGDASYNWQNPTFQPPVKTDLVIYELLIRDFDALHSFNGVKNRLDYLQNLGVNAIELMPVSEFDGNDSWGYNPSFHMALDKYYGSKNALKQLIDECHTRGIAVILDVVYNHASGQNPYYRLWNNSAGAYTGQASAENPFFNIEAKHSYNVFNDFNHGSSATQAYVKRTAQYWINEYKIDGFRWDLTKGFTQNCTANDETCTNAFQADRVSVLKQYADDQWEIDPNFYVIFEHLGTNTEETEWINYRLNEGKGIMVWGNHNYNYNEATMGYHQLENGQVKSDFSWISYLNRNWTIPANVSYMESHDEERLMYKNLQFGNESGAYSIKNLSTAIERQALAGVFYFTVPGPKMIWQFGELGYDYSIDFNGRTGVKPIRWDYLNVPDRKALHDLWSNLIKLKKQESIFKTSNFSLELDNSNGFKKIQLSDDAANPTVKHMTILGNFGTTNQTVNPNFQQSGSWYDILDNNSTINVTNTNATMTLAPGAFKLYASSPVTLGIEDITNVVETAVYPNPFQDFFRINQVVDEVNVYNPLGSLVKSFKGNSKTNQSFSLREFPASIYILKAKVNGAILVKKIIKI